MESFATAARVLDIHRSSSSSPCGPLQAGAVHSRLAKALMANRLDIHYAPKVDIRMSAGCGAEAVLMWRDVDLGDVSPYPLLEYAGCSDLSIALDILALKLVAVDYRTFVESTAQELAFSLALRATTVACPAFPETVKRILEKFDVAPQFVQLIIDDVQLHVKDPCFRENARTLSRSGISLATNYHLVEYSTARCLRDMGFDAWRLDASFANNNNHPAIDVTVDCALRMADVFSLDLTIANLAPNRRLDLLNGTGPRVVIGQIVGSLASLIKAKPRAAPADVVSMPEVAVIN